MPTKRPGKKRQSPPKFSSRPVDVAIELKNELELYDKSRDRSVLIKALRDQFLVHRYDAAGLVERDRLAALEILFDRMPGMSDSMLLKTVQVLSEIGAADLQSVASSSGRALPPLLQQNIGLLGASGGVTSDSNPIKSAGNILESLEHLATYFRGRIIDVSKN
jgi:hypothetical protein